MRPHLVRWQYEGYSQFHANLVNLLIHIVAVPAFIAGLGLLVVGVFGLDGARTAVGLGGMVVSFLAQGIGHKQEIVPSIPFDGPGDALSRIFVEQLVTFPRFVQSGSWRSALRRAHPKQPT